MKRLFSVMFSCAIAMVLLVSQAHVVSQEVAKETAERLLAADSEWQVAGDADITLVEKNGVPAYYVIQYNEGGWALVSAQSTSRPLIAYNHTGIFAAPEPLQIILDNHSNNIVHEAADLTRPMHLDWNVEMQRKPAMDPTTTPDIAPLIKIDLNQGDPFNSKCPTIGGDHVLVGCVAVGMGQAMMVARYPDRPQGKASYTCEGVGVLSIDYDSEADYNWEAMHSGDYNEIARLLYHCGVSVKMNYGLDGSGAQTPEVARALVRYFKYDEERVQFVDRGNNVKEWLSTLLDEMYLGRAVVYRGQSETSGHCWNLDGWKNTTQMVHVNWGWGGHGNGYYDIDAMEDKYQNMSFPYLHGAVLGVGSPTTAPYSVKLSKTKFIEGTAAGVALADVTVSCEDPNAKLVYELFGPKNITGKNIVSPYEVVDGKLVSKQTIENTAKFTYLLIRVTNENTGESVERDFAIQIVDGAAVESVLSNNMRLYPAVAEHAITIEVPVVGGEYAIYSLSGAQVAAGTLADYKTDVTIESLVAGTYVLRYEHNDGVGVKRFVKK